MDKKIFYMKKALELAKKSALEKEVPVGAIIVLDNEIISTGKNAREKENDALAHAEIKAIQGACKKLNSWRLTDCEMYVTLEPCPMCAGAVMNSRIKKVIFGAFDVKFGALGSVVNFFDLPFNHIPKIEGGILEEDSKNLLKNFFKKIRYNQVTSK